MFLDEHPESARPLILEREGLVVGEAARRLHHALGEVLDAGRGEVIVGSRLMPSTELIAELVVCAVVSILRARILADEEGSLAALAPSLMERIVEPYLGAGARRADKTTGSVSVSGQVLEASILPVRAHPRVLRALTVIAAAPGLSSREVEFAAALELVRDGSPGCLGVLSGSSRGALLSSVSWAAGGRAA